MIYIKKNNDRFINLLLNNENKMYKNYRIKLLRINKYIVDQIDLHIICANENQIEKYIFETILSELSKYL